jgi:hypothetical protein
MPNDTCDSLHAGYTSDVIFIRDFAFTVFGGKICNVWGREDGAGLLRVTERAFFSQNSRLFYVTTTG